ncbi:hypothetical protein PROFUN_09686 [Planoprotostelium fungivorum]|uniref:GPR1/FUN34/yaaH family protein n=1 Tax=Planoprotostelium fungivorum TaxID=1890364 RepID=A0A2P6NGL8_9EUKA|nr:hypothetical protein PROFUN_09686 [Planoprotostelium fungivorum]
MSTSEARYDLVNSRASTLSAGQQHITLTVEELSDVCRNIVGNSKFRVSQQSGESTCLHVRLIVLPVIADPGPLGLAGFAATTFVLSIFNAGVIIDPAVQGVVLPLALWYGGIAQGIAGIFEFFKPNTFGALAFLSYGAFWLSYQSFVLNIVPTIEATNIAFRAVGIYLLAWTIFTAYMTIAAWKVTRVIFALFLSLTITFLLLTIGAFTNNKIPTEMGGWLGIAVAIIAWYASAAAVVNGTWDRVIFPVGVVQKKNNEDPIPAKAPKTA